MSFFFVCFLGLFCSFFDLVVFFFDFFFFFFFFFVSRKIWLHSI